MGNGLKKNVHDKRGRLLDQDLAAELADLPVARAEEIQAEQEALVEIFDQDVADIEKRAIQEEKRLVQEDEDELADILNATVDIPYAIEKPVRPTARLDFGAAEDALDAKKWAEAKTNEILVDDLDTDFDDLVDLAESTTGAGEDNQALFTRPRRNGHQSANKSHDPDRTGERVASGSGAKSAHLTSKIDQIAAANGTLVAMGQPPIVGGARTVIPKARKLGDFAPE